MEVSMKWLREKYKCSSSKLCNIVYRAEFAKYRSGGNGGIYIEYCPEVDELIKSFMIRGKIKRMATQSERVYNHLQVFGSITNAQAHEMYGINHLPSVIRDVRDKYKVEFVKERQTGCNRYGEKVWWDKYIMRTPDKANKYWEGA